MVDTNLNLNLIGLLTSEGDINNWRNMHHCLQAEGYSNQLKDSEYHNQVDSFQKMIERDNQDLMSKV